MHVIILFIFSSISLVLSTDPVKIKSETVEIRFNPLNLTGDVNICSSKYDHKALIPTKQDLKTVMKDGKPIFVAIIPVSHTIWIDYVRCCEGFAAVSDGVTGKCLPICTPPCIGKMKCVAPNQCGCPSGTSCSSQSGQTATTAPKGKRSHAYMQSILNESLAPLPVVSSDEFVRFSEMTYVFPMVLGCIVALAFLLIGSVIMCYFKKKHTNDNEKRDIGVPQRTNKTTSYVRNSAYVREAAHDNLGLVTMRNHQDTTRPTIQFQPIPPPPGFGAPGVVTVAESYHNNVYQCIPERYHQRSSISP